MEFLAPVFNLIVVPYLGVLVTIIALLELCRPESLTTTVACYALPVVAVPSMLIGAYYVTDMFRKFPGAPVIPFLVWVAVGGSAVGAMAAASTVAVYRRHSKHPSPSR